MENVLIRDTQTDCLSGRVAVADTRNPVIRSQRASAVADTKYQAVHQETALGSAIPVNIGNLVVQSRRSGVGVVQVSAAVLSEVEEEAARGKRPKSVVSTGTIVPVVVVDFNVTHGVVVVVHVECTFQQNRLDEFCSRGADGVVGDADVVGSLNKR